MSRQRTHAFTTVLAPRRLRLKPIRVLALALFGASFAVDAANAGLTYLLSPAPGGFVQACAGPSTGGGYAWPGADQFLVYWPIAGANLVEQSFVGDSSGDVTAGYSGSNITNSSHAVAGLGFIQLSATNTAPDAAFFPTGIAHGGWSETFVISSRALTGQSGFMQFTLDVHGTLFAQGLTGSSAFTVTGYKDALPLQVNPLFDPGDSDVLQGDAQYGNWAIATYGNPPTDSKTVNDTITFAVPFNFGTPFKLGIYANARAGMRSSGGAGGSSSAQTHFEEGLAWGGITAIYLGMTPITQYTIESGSGINWEQPSGPADPADLDGNGVVNSADLAILLGAWGTSAGDIDGNGTTNAADLTMLLASWS